MALAVNVLLARLLGASEYGRYMTLLSVTLLLGPLAVRGDSSVLTREFASRSPEWRPVIARWAGIRASRGVAVVAILYLAWLAYSHRAWIYAGIGIDFVVGALLIGELAVMMLQGGALNGLGASLRSQAQALILKNGGMLLALAIIFWTLSGRMDATQALAAQVVGYCLALVIGWIWLHLALVPEAAWLKNEHPLASVTAPAMSSSLARHWAASSQSFLLAGVAALILNKLDVILVSALADDGTAGVYAAGARLAQVAQIVALSINIVLAPRFARASATHDNASIRSLLRQGLIITIPVALVESIIAVAFSHEIVGIFGRDYAGAAAPFMWVVLASALWTSAAPIYAQLSMAGSEKLVAGLSWLTLIVNMGAIFVLVPLDGAEGAAIAMVISSATTLFALIFLIASSRRGLWNS